MADTQEPSSLNLVPMHSEEPQIGNGQPRPRVATHSLKNSFDSAESKELDSAASAGDHRKSINKSGLPEINSPTSRNINVGSPMNLRGSDLSKRKLTMKRMSTKSEEVLAKNNFQ